MTIVCVFVAYEHTVPHHLLLLTGAMLDILECQKSIFKIWIVKKNAYVTHENIVKYFDNKFSMLIKIIFVYTFDAGKPEKNVTVLFRNTINSVKKSYGILFRKAIKYV